MVMIMDERTRRKYKLVQLHLREVGKFNPALREGKAKKVAVSSPVGSHTKPYTMEKFSPKSPVRTSHIGTFTKGK